MKAAYIWASALWQISMIGGGATLTYLSGVPWWFVGGFLLQSLQSYSVSIRLEKWSKQEQY